MPQTFRCKVITPTGAMLDRDATSVRFPAADGLVGVWPNHGPMISLVGEGYLTLRTADDLAWFLQMNGGFAEVRDNVLTILAEQTGELLERSPEAETKPLEQAKRELSQSEPSPREARR